MPVYKVSLYAYFGVSFIKRHKIMLGINYPLMCATKKLL